MTAKYVGPAPSLKGASKQFQHWMDMVRLGRFQKIRTLLSYGDAYGGDPDDPKLDTYVMWMESVTGDIKVKINSKGTVKTTTLVDFSEV
jgi:hypothetical protein